MKQCLVENKFVNETMRLDGKFHLSEGLIVRDAVHNSPYRIAKISDVTSDIYCPGIFQRHYTSKGVSFLGGSDIKKASYDTGKYLKKITTPNHKILAIKKGWTLVTCGGTIGETAFVNEHLSRCWVSQHVMRLIPNEHIKEGMLYAYLASKYGKKLLTTNTYGSVIPTLNATNIGDLPIPVFPNEFQDNIDLLIQESAAFRDEANNVLEEAQKIIIETLDIKPHSRKIGVVKSQDILFSFKKRFEANYHISQGSEIESILRNKYECKNLGELCSSISRPDIFKRYYVNTGLCFLGSSDIFLASPTSLKQLSRKKTDNIQDLQLKEGMILIPRSGTIGDVAMAHAGHAQKLASEDVIRLIPNDILRGGYIYAFLSTYIGKSLIQRHIFGSVIQHVESPHLSRIPIPILDKAIMDNIDLKIQKYCRNIACSIQKENEAIHIVEKEIENWRK